MWEYHLHVTLCYLGLHVASWYLHVALQYLHWHCDVSFTHMLRCVLVSYRRRDSRMSQPPSS